MCVKEYVWGKAVVSAADYAENKERNSAQRWWSLLRFSISFVKTQENLLKIIFCWNQIVDGITSLNFSHQIVCYHDAITVTIDGYVLTSTTFKETWTDNFTGPQITTNRSFSGWNGSSLISAGCASSQSGNFCLFTYPLSLKWTWLLNRIWLINVGFSYNISRAEV